MVETARDTGGEAPAGRRPRRPHGPAVARLISPLVTRTGVIVAVMALVCLAGAVLSQRSVDGLARSVWPAETAQSAYVRDLSDLRASVADHALTGSADSAATYRQLLRTTAADENALVDATADSGALSQDVAREIAAARAWRSAYADRRMATTASGVPGSSGSPASPASFSTPTAVLDRRGEALFSSFVTARDQVTQSIGAQAGEATSTAGRRIQLVLIGIVLLLGVAWLLLARTRNTLYREVSVPLTGLERVVSAMLGPDPDARAEEDRGSQEVRSVAAALNDLADQQRRVREVEARIRAELLGLDGAKDDFVANISHELRTPLTTIRGYLELVDEEFEGRLDPHHEQMLRAMRRNVDRLSHLIDDLLTLSHAETGPTHREATDVTVLLFDAVGDLRLTASRRGIDIDVDTPDDPLPVLCDRVTLGRAFVNVLSNAVKFSHEHGHVRVTVSRDVDAVEVTVRDEGIGIAAGDLDRLGTRFFRGTNATTQEIAGTGLGLRIVQSIIHQHHGDVVVDSVEGEGTTVAIRLPLAL